MKYLMTLFICLTTCHINAQNYATVLALPLTEDDAGQHICFKVANEANIRQYVIEASLDSISFEVIGTLPCKGNTTSPRLYEFISITDYKYYRVKQTDYAGIVKAVLKITKPIKLKEPVNDSLLYPILTHNQK